MKILKQIDLPLLLIGVAAASVLYFEKVPFFPTMVVAVLIGLANYVGYARGVIRAEAAIQSAYKEFITETRKNLGLPPVPPTN